MATYSAFISALSAVKTKAISAYGESGADQLLETQLPFLRELIAQQKTIADDARVDTRPIRPEYAYAEGRGVVNDTHFLPLVRRKAERILNNSPGVAPFLTKDSEGLRKRSVDPLAIIRWYRPVFTIAENRLMGS